MLNNSSFRVRIRQMVQFLFILSVSLLPGYGANVDEVSASNDDFANRKISISYCEFHTTHRFAVETVRTAYSRIGLSPTFVSRPCRRSLIEANAGHFDAEVARIAGINKLYTNLIPASSPTITIEGVIVTKNVTREISQWEDLYGLYIGIIRGELYAEEGTAAYEVEVAQSYSQLLKMLDRDRIEVAVVIRRDFELMMRSSEFLGVNLHIIGNPVFVAQLYHLVHKKNKDLLTKLNPTFMEMWENGEAEAIHRQTFQSLTEHRPYQN